MADKTGTPPRAAKDDNDEEVDAPERPTKASSAKSEQAKARERARQRAATDD